MLSNIRFYKIFIFSFISIFPLLNEIAPIEIILEGEASNKIEMSGLAWYETT